MNKAEDFPLIDDGRLATEQEIRDTVQANRAIYEALKAMAKEKPDSEPTDQS